MFLTDKQNCKTVYVACHYYVPTLHDAISHLHVYTNILLVQLHLPLHLHHRPACLHDDTAILLDYLCFNHFTTNQLLLYIFPLLSIL